MTLHLYVSPCITLYEGGTNSGTKHLSVGFLLHSKNWMIGWWTVSNPPKTLEANKCNYAHLCKMVSNLALQFFNGLLTTLVHSSYLPSSYLSSLTICSKLQKYINLYFLTQGLTQSDTKLTGRIKGDRLDAKKRKSDEQVPHSDLDHAAFTSLCESWWINS